MRKYETIFIINPDLSEEEIKGLIKKVREIVEGLQGQVLRIDEWGRRKLAYDLKKMSKGYYVLLHFIGKPQVLTEVERNLRLMDAVLKHQTVRLDEKGEKIAQMLSGERVPEKVEQPETRKEEKPEEREGKDIAEEEPGEATPGTDESESKVEEETQT